MKRISLVLLAALIAGCAAIPKQQDVHQKAAKQWSEARASIYFGLAQQQYKAADFNRSRQTVDQALAIDAKNVPSLLLSAKLWIENGQLEAAQRTLDQARAADAKNGEADYLSGIVYQRWQMPSKAFDYYSSACDKAPAELAYVLAKAEMMVTLGRQHEALELLSSKEQYFEHSAAIRDAIGQLLVDEHKYSQAVEMFRQAAILANDDPAMRERLGLAMYYAGQYHDASDVLSQLATDSNYANRIDLLTALGECDMHLGKLHDALSWFETASEVNPKSVTIWLRIAEASMQLNDLRRADIAAHKAITADPASSEAQLMVGYVRLRQNKLSDALDAFVNASNLNPQDSMSVAMAGFVYEKIGMKKEASECYARALQLHPADPLTIELMKKAHG